MAVVLLTAGISGKSFSIQNLLNNGGPAVLKVFLAYVAGIVITPLILPYIPGRHFSLKGLFSGAIIFIIMMVFGSAGDNITELVSWFLIITAISSFLAMNFTGSSTFTSLSGVRKEMKIFVPLQIGFASIGLVLQVVGKIIQ
jgi:acetyl-CoA decarbonylase/synthase complex subunit gamma